MRYLKKSYRKAFVKLNMLYAHWYRRFYASSSPACLEQFFVAGTQETVKRLRCQDDLVVLVCFFVVVVFPSLSRILGEFMTIHSPPALFFFFLKWKLAPRTLIHSLGQDQSTVAHLAETTVAGCSLTRRPYTYAFRKGLITVRSLKKKLKTKNPESYTTRAIALWIITVRPL